MKKVLSIAALVGLANLGFLAAPAAEAAQFTVGSGVGSPYNGDVCMDVAAGATQPFTPVQAWRCHGWFNQQWSMQGWTIYGIGSTGARQMCLDVQGGATAAGTFVNMFQCNNSTAQQWYYWNGRIINPRSGRCLDAGNRQNGTRLRINNCNNSEGQRWQIK